MAANESEIGDPSRSDVEDMDAQNPQLLLGRSPSARRDCARWP